MHLNIIGFILCPLAGFFFGKLLGYLYVSDLLDEIKISNKFCKIIVLLLLAAIFVVAWPNFLYSFFPG